MNALVVHLDSLTVVLMALLAEVGLFVGWLLFWTIRHRSAPTDPPVNALREAEKNRLSGSARTHVDTYGLDDDFEGETS